MDIGIGIIGTGGIARAHAGAYLDMAPEVGLVAVCDIDAARAKDAAAEWGVAEVCTDYRDLLSLDEIDAVSVCTPNAATASPPSLRSMRASTSWSKSRWRPARAQRGRWSLQPNAPTSC
ncbi:Gfo/Idh/MocA family oxidoreductase [bacterium]|nr:Gfo/Idh/MocA family oxidoreductase [bacterium]